MEFKINENFAKHYNEYRQKEEYQKLKSRYGDFKIGKSAVSNIDLDSESESSSESSSDEEWEEKQHEDFLRLYKAICCDDPALANPDTTWFRTKPDTSSEDCKIVADGEIKNKKQHPVLLKDHAREFLLSHGGIDNEADLQETHVLTKIDTLPKLNTDSKALKEKENFLQETEKLFNENLEKEDEVGDFMIKKKNSNFTSKTDVDTSNFTFQLPGGKEDEEFLCDYLVNRRWKPKRQQHAESSIDKKSVVDSFLVPKNASEQDAGCPPLSTKNDNQKLLIDEDNLEADDEFLVKARIFEHRWNTNDEELATEYPNTSSVRFRFHEEDNDVIKTYPRKIEGTLRQPAADKLTRSQLRKRRKERKEQEKTIKMSNLARLKQLKMIEFAEKINHIKKICGDGVSLSDEKLNVEDPIKSSLSDDVGEGNEEETVADLLVDNLENDWDPKEHEKLVEQLFNKNYYSASTQDDDLEHPPTISEDENFPESEFLPIAGLDSGDYDNYATGRDFENKDIIEKPKMSALASAVKELEEATVPKKRGKRAVARSRLHQALERPKPIFKSNKFDSYETFFNKFYQLDCEDIISGSGPSDDVHCRFKYREVKPNDFGLSVEEIFAADEKELNRWMPVKTMTAYRNNEEEDRDVYKYHSSKMLRKKLAIVPSLNDANRDDESISEDHIVSSDKILAPQDTTEAEKHSLSKKALKRLRKKQRKAHLFAQIPVQTEVEFVDQEPNKSEPSFVVKKAKRIRLEESDPVTNEVTKKHSKHYRSKPKISDERLRAAGIHPKQFKYMKTQIIDNK